MRARLPRREVLEIHVELGVERHSGRSHVHEPDAVGDLPVRFDSSELLTYSRLLSGVSFIIWAWGMVTVLTSFGCIGSATSYCCTAPPPNSETYKNLLS